jgi:beta-lactamase regulating signal transducer with metallopeptidase domain
MSAYLSFLTVLGWSLLDSIWQMAILWLTYYMLTAGNNRISSAGKHNLILVFAFIGAEWFVYTLIRLTNQPTIPYVSGLITVTSSANLWLSYLSFVYLAVLLFRFLQYLFQSYVPGKNKSGKSLSVDLQIITDRYSRILGVTKRVQVYLSDLVETAQTSGFLKPIILLPFSLLTRLTPKQLEAILIHELYHIRRNDYFSNICMSFFRNVFFFNPFAHLFSKALERERELACDDGVIELGFAADQYAAALYKLEKFRQVHPGFSLAADGNKPWLLMERICRLLGKPTVKKSRFNPIIFFSLIISVLLLSLKQKTSIHDGRVILVSVTHQPAEITHYVFEQEKISRFETGTTSKRLKHRKPARKMNANPGQLPFIPVPESPDQAVRAFYADNKIARNYSNQEAAGPNQAAIFSLPGTPYVPHVTLSYEAVPEIVWQDSIRDVTIQSGYENLIVENKIKAIANLQALEAEFVQNSKQLKEIETKNRKLILLDRKNIKPVMDEIHHQILLNKQKIDHLKIRLVTTEEEIIHI